MDGHVIPDGLFELDPWWTNFFENVTTIQFQHRLAAYAVAIAALVLWWRGGQLTLDRQTHIVRHHVLGFVALQILIGIVTLLAVAPLWLSAIHQVMAIVLFATAIFYAFRLVERAG
jgi:cytochrome c oxidase assembly protein subunit 15